MKVTSIIIKTAAVITAFLTLFSFGEQMLSFILDESGECINWGIVFFGCLLNVLLVALMFLLPSMIIWQCGVWLSEKAAEKTTLKK